MANNLDISSECREAAYQSLAESWGAITSQRQAMNSFFAALNVAIIFGVVAVWSSRTNHKDAVIGFIFLAFVSVIVSQLWLKSLGWYRHLSKVKSDMLKEIEPDLGNNKKSNLIVVQGQKIKEGNSYDLVAIEIVLAWLFLIVGDILILVIGWKLFSPVLSALIAVIGTTVLHFVEDWLIKKLSTK